MKAETRERGEIVSFDNKLGAGLLRSLAGELIFINYKDIESGGHRRLAAGQIVSFLRSEGPKAIRANRIRPVLGARPWRLITPGIGRNFAYKCLRSGSVRFMWGLLGREPTINSVRYYIASCRLFEVYINQLINSDEEVYHNHPWSFVSVVLRGGYVEEKPDGSVRWIRSWRPIKRQRGDFLRIIVPEEVRGAVWVLTITGPRSPQEWEFLRKDSDKVLSPSEYGLSKGVIARVSKDFGVKGFLFPRLRRGTSKPELLTANNDVRKPS